MQPEALLAYVRAKPFRAFRVTRTDGKTYDVVFPASLKIGHDFLVFMFMKHADAVADGFDFFGPEVVARVEYLDGLPAVTAAG